VNGRLTALTMIVCAAIAAVAVVGIGTHVTDRVEAGQRLPAVTGSVRPTQFKHIRARNVSAVAFLRGVIGRLAANDYARAWTSLDPRQQRLVHQDEYSRCENLSPIPGDLDRIDVLEAHTQRVVVPGSGNAATPSIVVTFRLTFAPRPSQNSVVVRVQAHAVRYAGRWAWMLPTKRLALHRSGRCGVSPPYVDPSL
jgi:hypothetical protein